MRNIIVQAALSSILVVGFSAFASAKLPEDVQNAYQTYEVAMSSQNFEQAEQTAYMAWMAAEETLGDSKITGDLAQNYADILAFNKGSFSKAKKAYRRAIELASFYPKEDAFSVRMNRTISLSAYAQSKRRLKHTKCDLDDVINAATLMDVQPSTFLGEIYTLRAGTVALNRNVKEAQAFGKKAEIIFASANDDIFSPYKAAASEYANLGMQKQSRFTSEQTPERNSATMTSLLRAGRPQNKFRLSCGVSGFSFKVIK